MNVYKKTDFKCSICGSSHNLTCAHFVPTWTRISDDSYENLIPLCGSCNKKINFNFIELGSLKYLSTTFLEMSLLYYSGLAKYLKKYIALYGEYRTQGKIDVNSTLAILSSYDEALNTIIKDWR